MTFIEVYIGTAIVSTVFIVRKIWIIKIIFFFKNAHGSIRETYFFLSGMYRHGGQASTGEVKNDRFYFVKFILRSHPCLRRTPNPTKKKFVIAREPIFGNAREKFHPDRIFFHLPPSPDRWSSFATCFNPIESRTWTYTSIVAHTQPQTVDRHTRSSRVPLSFVLRAAAAAAVASAAGSLFPYQENRVRRGLPCYRRCVV